MGCCDLNPGTCECSVHVSPLTSSALQTVTSAVLPRTSGASRIIAFSLKKRKRLLIYPFVVLGEEWEGDLEPLRPIGIANDKGMRAKEWKVMRTLGRERGGK